MKPRYQQSITRSFSSGYYTNQLKTMIDLLGKEGGPQVDYFKWQLENCREVKIESLQEVLPEELFNCIRRDKIHKKGCYQAAYSIVDSCYDKDLRYVEGFGRLHGVNIQHAWVSYKGRHFDPIAFFIFNEKTMILEEYDAIIELTKWELYDIVTKTNVYGPNIEPFYRYFVK